MQVFSRRFKQYVLICLSMLLVPGMALADGGTVRAMVEDGGLAISIFTSPAMLTAGEVDISVLVQDAESGKTLADAEVQVAIIRRKHPALSERRVATEGLATNRLLKSCHVQLEPGWYDVEVRVSNTGQRGRVEFAMLVGPAPTMAAGFWPWFTWPAVPVVLVIANLAYRQLQIRRSAIIHHSNSNSARPVS